VIHFKNNDLVKILIDHQININNKNNLLLIHYICYNSTPEMIKYIIDKGVDLECPDIDEWNPIHYICRYSTPEMIQYIIDKGVNLECINKNRLKPIHLICRYSTPGMIQYIIDKGVDLECTTNEGWKPIHLICRYSTPEMFKYIIDKGVNTVTTILKYNNKDVNYNLNDIINERFKEEENIQYSKNDFLQYLKMKKIYNILKMIF
jgi:ankyrin repeat protein